MKNPILFVAVVLATGCNRGSKAPVAERTEPTGAADQEQPVERDPAMQEACDEAYTVGTLPEPWFLADPPEACLESITHDSPELYDDCVSNGTSLEGCGAPETGIIVCQGNGFSWIPRTTQRCVADSDCPEGAACVDEEVPYAEGAHRFGPGQCEMRCTGDGRPAECVRCDMECDVAVGLCRAKRNVRPFKACEHTCQCSQPGDWCTNGSCTATLSVSDGEKCGDSGRCPCTGGECVDGCCVMPDGHIAGIGDPACFIPPP